MADNQRFVQFPHPGREHEPDLAGGKAWNTLNSQHARKFMEFGGKWIENDGSGRSGNLRAWGEWEAESDLVCGLIQPRQDSHYPRHLWHPYYIPRDNYQWLHNTDPFIFGERFLYSNCKQVTVSSLAHLGRGSVIAFGSGMKIAGNPEWVLDTVLVVADSLTYSAPEARRVLADAAPEAFLTVTGRPACRQRAGLFQALQGSNTRRSSRGDVQLLPRNAGARGSRVSSSTDRPSKRVFQPEELAGSEGSAATAHQ